MNTVPNCILLNFAENSYGANPSIIIPSTTSGSGAYIAFTNQTDGTTNFITSITGGGTWARVASKAQGSTALELWYLENATASVTTLTVSTSKGGFYAYAEFSGVLSSGSLDVSTSASTASTSWSLSTGSTSTVANPVELIIEVDCQLNGGKGGASNTPTGYVQAATFGTGASHIYMNYRIRMASVAAESTTINGSSQATSQVITILATFKLVANVIQQNTHNVVSSGSTSSLSIAAPYPANLQILTVDNISGGASTVTQTNATWTRLQSSATNAVTELWYSANASASAGTTITLGNACAAVYSEWFGGSASLTIDKSVTQSGSMSVGTTTNMVTGTTATTSSAPEVAIAAFGGDINQKSGTWSSPLNGYKVVGQTTTGGKSVNCIYNILTTTTTTSTGATLSPTLSTDGYGTVLATFQETSASEQPSLMITGIGSL